MTIASTTNRVSYAGNGSTLAFAFSHPYRASTDLVVTLRTVATGAETLQVEGTNYSVTGTPTTDAGGFASGTVTFTVAPAAGTQVHIDRVVPRTQPTDYVAGDGIPPSSIEGSLDRLTLQVQELDSRFERTLLQPRTAANRNLVLPEPTASDADKVLSVNGGGTAFVLVDPVGGIEDGNKGDITVSGAGATLTINADAVTTPKILDGAVTGAKIADKAVSLSKMADVSTETVFYRKSASTGAPEVQSLATLKTDLGLTGTNSGDQTISLTGDVTGSGSGSFAATIADEAVTNAKLAHVTTARIKGRVSASTGDVEDLTGTQATTLLDEFTSSAKGLAPASGGGSTNFLRADGQWAAPAGGGGGSQNLFETIAVSGQSSIVADSTTDTLTFAAGTNIALTTNATTDTLTIATTGLAASATTDATNASNIGSGTLDAARLPQFTGGDVTTSAAGSVNLQIAANAVGTTEIADNAVTLAKLADMATSSLIYRKTAGTGDPEVNTLATLKTDLGLTGTNSGDQTITLTGDVTGSGTGSFATTLASTAVTPAGYGSATQVGTFTVDAKGRLTAASNTNIALAASAITSGTIDNARLDADLAAIGNNSTNGVLARTGAGTAAARTITGTANEITVTNGDGVSGNPTLSLPTALTFTGKTVTGGTAVGLVNVRSAGFEIDETNQHRLYNIDASNIGVRVGTTGPYYKIGTTDTTNLRINASSNGDIVFSSGTSTGEITHLAIERTNDRVDFKNSKIFAHRFVQAADGPNYGEDIQVENSDQPNEVGVGLRKGVYIRTAKLNSAEFDAAQNTIAVFKNIEAGNVLSQWDVMISPLPYNSGLTGAPGNAQSFAAIVNEFNPTNRTGHWGGFEHEARLGKNRVGGFRGVPETQDFTNTLGATRVGVHCSYAFGVAPSSFPQNWDKRPVTFSTANDTATFTDNPGIITGLAVKFPTPTGGATLPTGITAGTTYYTIWASDTTCKFATSAANAAAGTAIDLTGSPSGTHTMELVEFYAAKFDAGFVSDPNSFAPNGYATFSYGYRPFVVSASVNSGGTGYAVNDILTLGVGAAAHEVPATVKVTAVSSGVITAVELLTAGHYQSAPSSPMNATGGTGSSASIAFVMSNAANQRPHAAHGIAGDWNYGIDCVTPVRGDASATYRRASFATHAVRLPNGTTNGIAARNNANTADVSLLYANSSDQAVLFDQKIIKRASWTPTFTSDGANPTVTAINGKYSQFDGIVQFNLVFQVTTHGTGSIKFTLPVAASGQGIVCFGADISNGAAMLCVNGSGGTDPVRCTTATLVNNSYYIITGTYEAASA